MSERKSVTIYTDGACSGNPGPGGWGALMRFGPSERQLKGGAQETTNNRMELTAAIEALNALSKPCNVRIFTDSQYVRNGITKWIHDWKARDWRTAANKPVKNAELWRILDGALESHSVSWHWVKGHAGNPDNETADRLAREGMAPYLPEDVPGNDASLETPADLPDCKRTFAYVDGFSLYHGALKNTPYRWLDLAGLIRAVLGQNYGIEKIKYFTANGSPRLGNPFMPQDQNVYVRALREHSPRIEVINGRVLSQNVRAPLANPADGMRQVEVVKTEARGINANLAVHLLNDAWLDAYDCAVVVSNDSGIAEAFRLVKKHTKKEIGLITPVNGHPSLHLKSHADFNRRIRPNALKNNQLPSPLPGTKLAKPNSW